MYYFTAIISHYKQTIFAYNHTFDRNLLGKENMVLGTSATCILIIWEVSLQSKGT